MPLEERKEFAKTLLDSDCIEVNSKQKLAIDAAYEISIKLEKGCKSQYDHQNPYFRAQFGMFTYFAPQWKLIRKKWSLENIDEVVLKCQEDKYVAAILMKCDAEKVFSQSQ